MNARHSRWFVGTLTAFCLFALAGTGLVADDDDAPKKSSGPRGGTFEGKWVNRKMGSSGPLRANISPTEDGDWQGRFEGTFRGQGFKYDVAFSAKTTATKTDFKGDAVIDGDPYQWAGSLKGDALNVKYRSSKGYNGDFTLKRAGETKKKPPKKKGGS